MRLPTPYRPESQAVVPCLEALQEALSWSAVIQQASPWVRAVRDQPSPFWAMESLLKEYPLSSDEGLALMRLAEALLRVPDAQTAIALTADQLGRADFAASSDAVMARLASRVMALSKHFLPEADSAPGLWARWGARAVVAAALRAVQLLGRQFVLGQTMDAALHAADAARKTNALRFSFDMLGEGARTDHDALRYLQSYQDAIAAIAARSNKTGPIAENDGISIKLSALYPRYEDAHRKAVLATLVPRVWTLCQAAAAANINLTIDAEEVDRLELSLDVLEALIGLVAQQMPQWPGLGLAMQAYQTRAVALTDHVIALARRYRVKLMCRLVKGAYWDAEIKRAQELGLEHYPVFTHKHHTDASYLACARALLAAPDAVYPQFAGHNAGTIAAIVQLAANAAHPGTATGAGYGPEVGGQFELQRLHGMGEGVFREVLKNPQIACRVYAPVGAHKDLLAYLVRRLLENGANSSFVHRLADVAVSAEDLLQSPLHVSPQPNLPLPADLLGVHPGRRINSAGVDLAVASQRDPIWAAWRLAQVPVVPVSDLPSVVQAYEISEVCYEQWNSTPVEERAAALRRAADALQSALPAFCALLVKEAFKTWGDAVAEVREAVDFLRYYADEAQRIMQPMACPVVPHAQAGYAFGVTGETNTLRLTGRGVWVCISPWNFPLAIFVGQVAAALATGNTVLAKPAEQTPGVARVMVDLLVAAGVPADAVQLLHGAGDTVGAALVAQPGVAGVVFTGSTQVAKIIQRALAAKDGPRGPDGPPAPMVPLIAETGGINAMLVDSSALPEQVVDAVLTSAFRSAGQRCSALRLLVLHSAIADGVIEMLQGAVAELRVGDPADLATDLGPVIDREAFDTIQRHIARLKREATLLVGPVEGALGSPHIPHLVAPHAFEVRDIASVSAEIFGPVLQVVRWDGDPHAVIKQINALGYGLTLGIQTRIDSRALALAAAARVGNVYINRNMIGAVVGVQPFGGEGLSGTGPKAGGPHYLYRFCAEQTITVNTAAAGGNAALLASMA